MATITQSFSLRPLGKSFGMEVVGLDLGRTLTPDDSAALSRALDAHIALLFRGQEITEEQQIKLANVFGEPSLRSRPDELRVEASPYARAIGLVTNVREDGKPIGSLPDGEMWFHHDGCFIAEPYRATLLYAVQVPSYGGNTKVLDMYGAYERLPKSIKSKLEGRTCIHIFDYSTLAQRPDPDRDLSTVRHARHPAVVRHPHTGRKALYINPLFTSRIEGIPRDESDALLEEICRFTENLDLVYSHAWQQRDLLVWDNWGSCHAREDFPADQIRMLRRSIVKGRALAAA